MKIYNGTYTVVSPSGEHRTFEIKTKAEDASFAPGKRVLSLLTGPNNEADYKGFAFVSDDGIVVWKKDRGTEAQPTVWDKYAKMVWSLCTQGEASGYYKLGCRILVERRCVKCNRKLTHPESIELGIGPECGGRV